MFSKLDYRARRTPALGVSTRLAVEIDSGYAVLRDESGRAAWVFRLAAGEQAAPAARPDSAAAPASGGAIAAVLAVGAVGAAAIFALVWYVRHRRSVDSRYKAIIDQTNDGIVIVDAARHQIQYCNPAFLARIGYTSAEAEQLTLSDVFADADASAEIVLSRLKEADSQMALNMQLRCKSGVLLDVEVRCNKLDGDGRDGLAAPRYPV